MEVSLPMAQANPSTTNSYLNYESLLIKSLITNREIEILRLISQGCTSREIGNELYISQHTVISHRKNLLDKTGARNTAHLVMKCVELGML